MATLVHFCHDPISEFDRSACSHARTFPTEARQVPSCHINVYRPRLDLYESKDTNAVTATFELPGLTSDDVSINVQQNRLTVSGEYPTAESRKERGHVTCERRSGKFSRTLQLPSGTKPEDVKAKMENGLLTITFPRTPSGQPGQQIPIL